MKAVSEMTVKLSSPHSIRAPGHCKLPNQVPYCHGVPCTECHQGKPVLPHSATCPPAPGEHMDDVTCSAVLTITVYADGLKGKVAIIWKSDQEYDELLKSFWTILFTINVRFTRKVIWKPIPVLFLCLVPHFWEEAWILKLKFKLCFSPCWIAEN